MTTAEPALAGIVTGGCAYASRGPLANATGSNSDPPRRKIGGADELCHYAE